MSDKFLYSHVTKEARHEHNKQKGLPDTKSGKMLNIINYSTGQKPTSRLKLGVCKTPCAK